MKRMTLSVIMGDLLKAKIYFENLQNEDDALIYDCYGHVNYWTDEYDLAWENFQTSYGLMVKH
jgi:hypothetical protein